MIRRATNYILLKEKNAKKMLPELRLSAGLRSKCIDCKTGNNMQNKYILSA